MAVIATLSTITLLLYVNFTEHARVARAVADIQIVSSEITTFEMMNERLPNDLAEIGRATLKDPWGNPYEYLNFALGGKPRKDGKLKPINSDYDLYSKGKDGESKENMNSKESTDDVVRAFDGQFIDLAVKFVP